MFWWLCCFSLFTGDERTWSKHCRFFLFHWRSTKHSELSGKIAAGLQPIKWSAKLRQQRSKLHLPVFLQYPLLLGWSGTEVLRVFSECSWSKTWSSYTGESTSPSWYLGWLKAGIRTTFCLIKLVMGFSCFLVSHLQKNLKQALVRKKLEHWYWYMYEIYIISWNFREFKQIHSQRFSLWSPHVFLLPFLIA